MFLNIFSINFSFEGISLRIRFWDKLLDEFSEKSCSPGKSIFEVLKVFLGGGPSKNHIWSVIAPILKLGWNF